MAWARVQSASTAATSSAVTSVSATYGTNLTSGTKLIAVVATSTQTGGTSSPQVTSVKDAAGNTFTLVGFADYISSNVLFCDVTIWARDTPSGDVGTKPAITATLDTGTANMSILIQEVSGLLAGNTLAMVDGTAAALLGSGNSGSTGSPAYTSTASNEYLVSVYGDDGGPLTWTKPAALTSDANNLNTQSFANIALAYGNSTNGAEAGSWALSGTRADWGTILVAFKLSSTSGTVPGGTAGLTFTAQPGQVSTTTAVFPAAPLDVRAELNLSGTTWTDITSYVYQRDSATPVTLHRGRPDESSQVDPASAAFELNNRDGRFTVLNPTGPYYGQINRNTPVRFSVPATTNYLRFETDTSSYASAPDTAANSVTGDLEIQIDLKLSSYVKSALVSKWNNVGGVNQASWFLELLASGILYFIWSPDGTVGGDWAVTSTAPIPLGRTAVKVTLAVATGTVTFYTAPTIAGGWAQLGSAASPTSRASTSVFNSTAPVIIGFNPYLASGTAGMTGSVYGFKLLNGIGGTVAAGPDFTAQTGGVTQFNDAYGNTWTLNGTAEISARDYRFHGEMSALPTTWDPSGSDVWTPATAGGLLRRQGQGNAPVYSAMKRGVLQLTGASVPVAYWPCEDIAGSTSIGSAIGGLSMSVNNAAGGTAIAYAGDSSFACSAPIPTVNNSSWYGVVPPYASNGAIVVRWLMNITSAPAANGYRYIRVITSGTAIEVALYSGMSTTSFGFAAYSNSGTLFDTGIFVLASITGQGWFSIEMSPISGGRVQCNLVYLQPGQSVGFILFSQTFTGTVGECTAVYVNPFQSPISAGMGHITVQSSVTSIYSLYQQLNAWIGETAGNRFARLCAENGYQARIYGPPDTSAAMGAQSPGSLPTLLQECETADMGVTYEPRQALAIGYRTQASLYAQSPAVTLSYSAAALGGISGSDTLTPTYDDQYTRNDITAQRSSTTGAATGTGGASYRAYLNDGSQMSISAPPAGVGDYSNSVTANVQSDSQLPDIAWWLVHLGTVNTYRWPVVPVNMARAEITAAASDAYTDLYAATYGASVAVQAQSADLGDYAEITGPPGWLPPDPVRQLVAATTEVLGGFHRTITFACVPESPYECGLYDDATFGRCDTDGSTLASAATTGATSLSVASAGIIWTTAASDLPFDIGVDGERMTVTAITGASSPQTFTVTRSVNGVAKAHAAGASVSLWFPPVYALT